MPHENQIDLAKSKSGGFIHLFVVAICFAFSVAMIYLRPGNSGWNSMTTGGVSEFSATFGVVFFSIYGVFTAIGLLRFGAVVSVGERGIFDRRLSTGWIPWKEIRTVSNMDGKSGDGLIFRLNQNTGVNLPIRTRADNILRMNASGVPRELWVESDRLKGGFKALRNAVTRFHRIIDDPWAQ